MPDVSQHGNMQGARNVKWESKAIKDFMAFAIPDSGFLSLDYVSPPHCAPQRSTGTATNILVGDVIEALNDSVCCAEDKYEALRLISPHLILTAAQVQRLCDLFPNPHARVSKRRSLIIFREVVKCQWARNEARGEHMVSAFKLHLNCRVEIFVCLYNRCIDAQELCTHEHLYDANMFAPMDAVQIRDRLGHSRTFDCLHCSQHIDLPRLLTRNGSQMSESQLTLAARKLSELSELSEAEAPAEEGRSYQLLLSLYEDWVCAKALMAMLGKEPGEIIKADWSERGFLGNDTSCGSYSFIVPLTWRPNPPKVGCFSCIYKCCQEKVNSDGRKSVAQQLCGWEPD
jgi:hypothetical protein